MLIKRLGTLAHPCELLRALSTATARHHFAPPAGFIGNWAGSAAIIVPSIRLDPVDPGKVFDVSPGGSTTAIGGGWFGYISYPDLGSSGIPPRIPLAVGGWTDQVLRCDHQGCWWWESLTDQPMPGWVEDTLTTQVSRGHYRLHWHYPDQEQHYRRIFSCLDSIRAGDIYQACVCTQFHGVFTGDPLDFFLDALYPTIPDKAAYLCGSWGAVASFSPELFLSRRGSTVVSSPIKGTLPLCEHPSQLQSSVKDVAENVMIVDLVRNDLSRLAHPGTVRAEELLTIHQAPGVWHLVSTVSARIPTSVSTQSLLEATFPPASVTGTPKLRARELISHWESSPRGIYCGAIGFASPVAGMELSVAIRTVEFDSTGAAILGVGGGITIDSSPDREWQECLDKASSIINS